MDNKYYPYLMENPAESVRLEIKTDTEAVMSQASWCGVKPGMRILDVGCGSGKTASILYDMIQPNGSLIGIDLSENRIKYAKEKHGNKPGLEFLAVDFTKPINGLGQFDLIWVRFVLEYFRDGAIDIVKNLSESLKPGGSLCLLDLDQNCMSHYPLPPEMEIILHSVIKRLENEHNFDPYAGRKLFSHLYKLNYENIEADMSAHHLIYGKLQQQDQFNWLTKLKVISEKAKDLFEPYPGGAEGFLSDFSKFLNHPGRFIYTPLILVKGKKPR
jgi:ubiquinone/menaquinone biosynthesis C-methylase UbiE